MPLHRRAYLAALTGAAATLAGCSDALSPGTPTPTETPFTWRVRRRPVYFGPGVGRQPPDYMQVVEDPADAVLVVLDENTDVSGDRVVGWLRDGLAVGVLGNGAVERLFDLLQAGDAGEYFDASVMVPGDMESIDGAVVEPLAAEEDDKPGLGTGFVDNDDWVEVVDSMLRGLDK
jgi:hypothetical protein